MKCPVCESTNVSDSPEKLMRGLDLGFGVKFSVESWDQICSDCGFIGSFDAAMDQKYEAAYLKAQERLTQIVSDKLRSVGSDTEIERAFHLSPYSIRKWRECKDLSHTTTALLRTLAKYPHILEGELREWRKKTDQRKHRPD